MLLLLCRLRLLFCLAATTRNLITEFPFHRSLQSKMRETRKWSAAGIIFFCFCYFPFYAVSRPLSLCLSFSSETCTIGGNVNAVQRQNIRQQNERSISRAHGDVYIAAGRSPSSSISFSSVCRTGQFDGETKAVRGTSRVC